MSDPVVEQLTTHELRVLKMMADGMTNSDIASGLERSGETIKSHARHILEKLGAKSRAHAVSIGYRRGLLSVNE